MSTLFSGIWPWIIAAGAALGALWGLFASAKKAGKAEARAEQAAADAKARDTADQIDNDIHTMPIEMRREQLRKWKPK
jgi:hypothetical protein